MHVLISRTSQSPVALDVKGPGAWAYSSAPFRWGESEPRYDFGLRKKGGLAALFFSVPFMSTTIPYHSFSFLVLSIL